MQDHRISYGIDHNISLADQKYLLSKYQRWIKGIYTGIPSKELQMELTSRSDEFLASYNQEYQDEIIDYARELGLEVNFTINNMYAELSKEQWKQAAEVINRYRPNEICTLDKYVNFFKEHCIPGIRYARSFYNLSKVAEDVDYDTYICKNSLILNPEAIDLNKSYRIVLNFACPWSCKLCGDLEARARNTDLSILKHQRIFFKEIQDMFDSSIEKYLAYHCWSGYDYNRFEERFSKLNVSYKFANRTNSHNQDISVVERILNNYISDEFFDFRENAFFNVTHIFGSDLPHFLGRYNKAYWHLDMELFKKYKNEYWAMIDSKLDAAKAKGISFS